jgi:hypothetical protein
VPKIAFAFPMKWPLRGKPLIRFLARFVAGEILKMCGVMSVLAREKESLGDREPILVDGSFLPRRLPMAPRPLALRPVKRSLVPTEQRAG